MKIFLIGMPGSGKSTLGKQLAAHLNCEFVDLDAEIERDAGKAISAIFRDQGEGEFRLAEARLLREWAVSPRSFVMSTGGGAPCFHDGIGVINQFGLSIFLDCSLNEIIRRVKVNKERPLLLSKDEDELRERLEGMRNARMDCYRKAMLTLQNPTLSSLLEAIHARK